MSVQSGLKPGVRTKADPQVHGVGRQARFQTTLTGQIWTVILRYVTYAAPYHGNYGVAVPGHRPCTSLAIRDLTSHQALTAWFGRPVSLGPHLCSTYHIHSIKKALRGDDLVYEGALLLQKHN